MSHNLNNLISEEDLNEINHRQEERRIEIQNEMLDEEYERFNQWAEERSEGLGVTPGTGYSVNPYREIPVTPEEDEAFDYLADASVNPKEAMATRDQKPPLHLLEHAADVEIAKAMAHGAEKYGRKNFQDTPILANVYGGAIRRHIGAWLDGEINDPDSDLSHLAHIGANIHVLFSAMKHGSFVDDRGPEERSAVQQRMSDASNRSRP